MGEHRKNKCLQVSFPYHNDDSGIERAREGFLWI